jgi:hypothetical protein
MSEARLKEDSAMEEGQVMGYAGGRVGQGDEPFPFTVEGESVKKGKKARETYAETALDAESDSLQVHQAVWRAAGGSQDAGGQIEGPESIRSIGGEMQKQ